MKFFEYLPQIVKKDFIGLVGVVCLALSGISWLIQAQFGTIPAVLAIIGLIGLLVYLISHFKTIQAQFSKRSVKYGTNVAVMILIVFGIVVLIEAISSQHNFLLDLTKNKRFTLSEQTKKVLNALDKDITILAFFTPERGNPASLKDVFEPYTRVTSRIKYELIDPIKNPGRAKTYEIATDGAIILETPERREKIADLSEASIVNALVKVTRKGEKMVYFLKGHGEHDLDNTEKNGYNLVKKAIADQNYVVKDLLLLEQRTISDDASVLIVAGPQKDLTDGELEAFKAYLQKGGNILLLLDPEQAEGMIAFLKGYGITLGDDTVLEPSLRLMGAGMEVPVVAQYQQHPITETLNVYTCFPLARSVREEQPLPEGVTVQPLVLTSAESWAETNKEELRKGRVEFNPQSDVRGPVPLAAVSTITLTKAANDQGNGEQGTQKPKQARLVVFGDSDFINNAYLGFYGNRDLFLNAVSWLAEEEDLIAIRPKNPEVSPLQLTGLQVRFAFLLSMMLLPFIVIFTGITVYIKRRQATR